MASRDVSALIAASRPARRRDVSAAPPRPRAAAQPRPRGPRSRPPAGRDAAGLHRPPQLPGAGAGRGALLQGLRQDPGGGPQERVSAARPGPSCRPPAERGPARARGGGRGGSTAGPAGRPAGRAGPPRHLSRLWGQGGGAWGCGEMRGQRTPVFPWQRGQDLGRCGRGAGRPCSHGNGGVPAAVIGCWGGPVCAPRGERVSPGGSLVSPGPPKGEPGQHPQNRIGGQTPLFPGPVAAAGLFWVCPRSPGWGQGRQLGGVCPPPTCVPAAGGVCAPPRVFRQLRGLDPAQRIQVWIFQEKTNCFFVGHFYFLQETQPEVFLTKAKWKTDFIIVSQEN